MKVYGAETQGRKSNPTKLKLNRLHPIQECAYAYVYRIWHELVIFFTQSVPETEHFTSQSIPVE